MNAKQVLASGDQSSAVGTWCQRGSPCRRPALEARNGGAQHSLGRGPGDELRGHGHLHAQVLGLRVNFQEPTTVEFSTSEGDQFQVMAPGDPYYDFFTQNGSGPVPLFEGGDVHLARRELEEAGVEVIGATGRDSRWEWIHFRAPDGNLYELPSRLPGTA